MAATRSTSRAYPPDRAAGTRPWWYLNPFAKPTSRQPNTARLQDDAIMRVQHLTSEPGRLIFNTPGNRAAHHRTQKFCQEILDSMRMWNMAFNKIVGLP